MSVLDTSSIILRSLVTSLILTICGETSQNGKEESILDVNMLVDEFEGPFLVEEVNDLFCGSCGLQ